MPPQSNIGRDTGWRTPVTAQASDFFYGVMRIRGSEQWFLISIHIKHNEEKHKSKRDAFVVELKQYVLLNWKM